jgi:hypothetical protein
VSQGKGKFAQTGIEPECHPTGAGLCLSKYPPDQPKLATSFACVQLGSLACCFRFSIPLRRSQGQATLLTSNGSHAKQERKTKRRNQNSTPQNHKITESQNHKNIKTQFHSNRVTRSVINGQN